MRLKSLEIHGFKSFADKTKFEFHPGVTGVVGPNGCGKSNVVDAIRWVLGETSAKALRGGEMADVIFNGTDKRKPVGMAEVRLTFADCEAALGVEYNEMSIGRRVYRDGKSEYLLNNATCRLKDIHELFMDTGIGRSAYSIMEQGKIDMLLSSRPEDRRAVFEEAAGITRFKSQKKEALRKLDYTEANLLRLSDVIEEVSRRKNSLNRQAAKARRYQTLFDDVKILDTHFSHRRFTDYSAEKEELENSVLSLGKGQATLEEGIAKRERDIVAARDALQSLESEISARREEVMRLQNDAQAAKSRAQFNEERNTELSGLITQHTADIEATTENLSKQKNELQTTSETLVRMEEAIVRQRIQLQTQQEKNTAERQERQRLDTALRETHNLANRAESSLIALQSQIRGSHSQMEADRERNNQFVKEIATLSDARAQKEAEEKELREAITAKIAALEAAQAQLTAIEAQHHQARLDQEALQKALAALHREAGQKKSRLDVLKQLVAKGEGLQKGAQSVLKGLDNPDFFKNGIRGILSTFLEVESDYIPAIEAALGSHLQAIVVSDPAMAESMILTLASKKLGEASLVPEQFISGGGSQMMTVPEGAMAWALDKVKAQERVRPLIDRLLGNVLIVDTLSTALRLREHLGDTAIATSDGAFISAEGIIHGGSGNNNSSSILQRQREIKDLETESARLDADLAERETQAERIAASIRDLAVQLEEKRETLQHAKVAKSTLEGQLSLVQREINQMKSRLDSLSWEQAQLAKRQETAATAVAGLEEKITSTEKDLVEQKARRSELEQGLEQATRREQESSERLNEFRTTLAVEEKSFQSLQQQKEPIAARMRELEALLARRQTEIAAYRERIANGNTESTNLREQAETAIKTATEIGTRIAVLSEDRGVRATAVQTCEQALTESRRELGSVTSQKGREEIKITQIDLRIENLEESVLQRYQIHLALFEPDVHSLLGAIETQKKAHSRRSKRLSPIDGGSDEDSDMNPSDESEIIEASTREDEDDNQNLLQLEGDGPDWEFVELVVGELKQRLDAMGPVNLDAIQEFEELEERHTFLQTQHDDLVNSKAELLRVIAKINTTTQEMFAETFEKVRENFKLMFRELFGEAARANLILLDDEDPLESGIDVIAKPPGKKLQSITLLSGGERSMTAVALLFAIYMVKPSPFCVLDELDAPLDESNIGRFLTMLDRFTDQSQFVIVTHNKRTMNRCDVIYGVTMEEFGVSKPIGMKFSGNKEPGEDTTPAYSERYAEA